MGKNINNESKPDPIGTHVSDLNDSPKIHEASIDELEKLELEQPEKIDTTKHHYLYETKIHEDNKKIINVKRKNKNKTNKNRIRNSIVGKKLDRIDEGNENTKEFTENPSDSPITSINPFESSDNNSSSSKEDKSILKPIEQTVANGDTNRLEKKSNLNKLRNLFKRSKKSNPPKPEALPKEKKQKTKSLLDKLSALAPEKNPKSSIGARGTDGLFNEKRGANKKRKKTGLKRNKKGIMS